MGVIESVRAAIAPIIEESGIYLEEVTLTGGSPKVLAVIVDSDSHLTLDEVTAVTKSISDILEELPELGETPFTLEVSSPGIDRPLTLPRHWRKNQGRLATLQLHNGQLLKGRIGEYLDDQITIDEQKVALGDIAKANVEIEFKSLKKESNS
jgi:ribosome maturation factor RimP